MCTFACVEENILTHILWQLVFTVSYMIYHSHYLTVDLKKILYHVNSKLMLYRFNYAKQTMGPNTEVKMD